jgi:chromate reductase
MSDNLPKILAITGSVRPGSASQYIINYLTEKFSGIAEIHLFKSLSELPYFDPGIAEGNIPEPVRRFREDIASSDGVLFCTPEYVFSLPGILKNALEWTVSMTIFTQKPVAIIIAAASGEKALESLELIMETFSAALDKDSTLLIKAAKGRLGSAGEITDKQLEADLKSLFEAFAKRIGSQQ